MSKRSSPSRRLTDTDIQPLVQLLQSGRMGDAEAQCRALIRKFPRAFVLYNILGAALTGQQKTAEAVQCFRQALKINRKLPEAHNNLGIALYDNRDLKDAVAAFRKALDLKRDYPEAHNNLGIALSDLGRTDEAIASYQAALAQAPRYAEAHNNLGAALQDRDDLDAAASSFQQALTLQPDYAEAHNNLGNVYHQLGEHRLAVESYRQALRHQPQYAEAHSNMGNAWKDLGRLEEAVSSYRNALALNPRIAETHNNIGNALRVLGDVDGAIGHLREAVALRPDHAETHNNLGVALRDKGEREAAIECYRTALGINPGYEDAYINFGGTLLALGRFDEAIACYRTIDPECTRANFSAIILECYFYKGDRAGYAAQLDGIRKQPAYNFRAGAATAFIAKQWGGDNPYDFCGDPLSLVSTYDAFADSRVSASRLRDIEADIYRELWDERYTSGHISAGYKSVGNLFASPGTHVAGLDDMLRDYIARYFTEHRSRRCLFIDDWPDDYDLEGWYIRLKQGGEITAHVHTGWVSGILYLRVPPRDDPTEGSIEFTLHGYDLPVLHDDFPRKIVETEPGLLVLFPSSLPHRVFPFSADEERLCIAFDMIPRRR